MALTETTETISTDIKKVFIPAPDMITFLESQGVVIPPGQPTAVVERVDGQPGITLTWRTVT